VASAARTSKLLGAHSFVPVYIPTSAVRLTKRARLTAAAQRIVSPAQVALWCRAVHGGRPAALEFAVRPAKVARSA